MKKNRFSRGAAAAAFLAVVLISLLAASAAFAQSLETGVKEQTQPAVWHYFGATIGLGLVVIGAALGIGKFAAAAAESIARQPAAAAQISGAVNLPLFLLEGVSVLAEVFILLVVLMK
jgi:F-type H+-transporting ATPase subunit c